MERRVRFVVLALAAFIASPAAAQIQTGSITVKTVDEQDAVMPGVKILRFGER